MQPLLEKDLILFGVARAMKSIYLKGKFLVLVQALFFTLFLSGPLKHLILLIKTSMIYIYIYIYKQISQSHSTLVSRLRRVGSGRVNEFPRTTLSTHPHAHRLASYIVSNNFVSGYIYTSLWPSSSDTILSDDSASLGKYQNLHRIQDKLTIFYKSSLRKDSLSIVACAST